MNIKSILSFCILLLYIPMTAQSKLKKVTEVKYKVASITDTSVQKDTLCDRIGCYNIKMYNAKGKQTDLISYDKNNKVVFRSALSYLENGEIEKVQSFNDKDEMTFNDQYIYEDNKLIRIENYYGNQVLNYYEKYSYHKNELIAIEKYQRDDKIIAKEEIENDKTIKMTKYGYYGFSTIVYTSEYNKAKLLVRKKKSSLHENGAEELLETETYTYDEKNRLVETVITTHGQPVETFTYEYDDNDNWVKRWHSSKYGHQLNERSLLYY